MPPEETTATPAAVHTPVAAPPATPPAPATPAPTPPAADPKPGEAGFLAARLERAKKTGAKEAKREIKAELKETKRAAKDASKAVEIANADLAAAKSFADAFLADLPEADRTAISKAANGNVSKTLEMLAAYKIGKGQTTAAPATPAATPQAGATATPPAAPPAGAPPVPAPATTAPAGGAPPPPAPTSTNDARDTYDTLRGANPYLAAQFLLNNRDAIYPDRTIDQVKAARR